MLFVWLLGLPVVVYVTRIFMRETPSLTKTGRIARIIYLVLIAFYAVLLFSEKYNYYVRGYRSTSFVFLAVTAGGILYCLTDRRPILASFTRTLLNLIAIGFMACSSFLSYEIIDDYNRQLFYSDNRYRIEETGRGIMNPCRLPDLFIKKGITERKCPFVTSDSLGCFPKEEVYDISISYEDSCYAVSYYFVKDKSSANPIPLKARYSLP